MRRGTRYMFAQSFRKHGPFTMKTWFTNYKVGDIVDIKGNGAQQKGMPHKGYHGKTGRVYTVTRRAVGVVCNKRIKNRILAKRINVRIEHVKHSTSRQGHIDRAAKNDALKAAANKEGKKAGNMKRIAQQPREGHFLSTKNNAVETVAPIKFEFLF